MNDASGKLTPELAGISLERTSPKRSGSDQEAETGYVDRLSRVYVEATNRCNLSCRTCVRNTWNTFPGTMLWEIFQTLLGDLEDFPTFPEIFFGGYGEPLSHPRIMDMIRLAHSRGAKTSLITNGTLLSPQLNQEIAAAGLDFLWVSLDGAHSGSYQDVRLGDHLPQILDNLKTLQAAGLDKPALGIASVLMKQNAADLPELLALCENLAVDSLFLTHVEVYDDSMVDEILYREEVSREKHFPSSQIELTERAGVNLARLLAREYPFRITGSLTERTSGCPFLDRGAAVVRWDGAVSPCLPLLYEHNTFTPSWKRRSIPYQVGRIQEQTFKDLWSNPRYHSLRKRLKEQSFSPCVTCRDCWLSYDNKQDCMGYAHPTCGGCLWAEGLIQCP